MLAKLARMGAIGSLALSLLAAAMLSLPAAAAAKGTATVRTGTCSISSDWKLKVQPDNGRLEVQFEVDQNRVGQTWTVKLKHNGTVFFSGRRTTQAPSGSFSITRRTSNAPGSDKIVGRAVNSRTGEICRGVVVF